MHDLILFLQELVKSITVVVLALIGLCALIAILCAVAARHPHSKIGAMVRFTMGFVCLVICSLAGLEFFNPIMAAIPGVDVANWTGSALIEVISGVFALINFLAGARAAHKNAPKNELKNVTPTQN